MATISRLRRSERRPDRVIVTIDDTLSLSVPLDLAVGLRSDQDIDDNALEALRAEAEFRRALDRCLGLLGRRPRSRAEVERYLADKAVTGAAAEHVVRHLSDLGLLDDGAFARWWVENRTEHRPCSRRALRYELSQKGVDPSVIAEALETVSDESLALAAAKAQMARDRDRRPEDRAKRLLAFLRRRGFGYSTAASAVREVTRAGGTEE